jgi:hypothetical protein
MTPTRKEYLFKLTDLSEESHTANYIFRVVSEIIDKIGPNKDISSGVRQHLQCAQCTSTDLTKIPQYRKY